jgi:Leucine-rich repeat (LRR) protein
LENNQISDISSLAKLTDIRVIYLDNNLINDISPLKMLRKIGDWDEWMKEVNGLKIHLGLSNNKISDISPLVHNSGIGAGDVIDLTGNPLNNEAYSLYIPEKPLRLSASLRALIERGVFCSV